MGIDIKKVDRFGACPLDTAVEQPVGRFFPRTRNDDMFGNQYGQSTAAREVMGSRVGGWGPNTVPALCTTGLGNAGNIRIPSVCVPE